MIKLSSGLRTAILNQWGMRIMMNLGVIDIYSSPRPDFADQAPTGTLLARVTTNGDSFVPHQGTNGLVLLQRPDGSLIDSGNWYITGITQGAADWWRWKWAEHDPDTYNGFYPRVDGDVGEALIMPTYTITPGLKTKIDEFNLTLGVC